jgi:hypothetical protein
VSLSEQPLLTLCSDARSGGTRPGHAGGDPMKNAEPRYKR